MATTTNYGWSTPDDTALVKDGAAAIRTLGSSADTTTKNLNPETTLGDLSFRSSTSNVNTRIPIGSSGQHLTVVAGVPAWSTASDQTPLTTKGDIFTFSTVDARLAVGTNGQVLTADSSEATGLKFATPASGGKVLQVVNATNSTSQTITSTSMVASNLTGTITPTSATSKILVILSEPVYLSRASASTGSEGRLMRDATQIRYFDPLLLGAFTGATTADIGVSNSITDLDSPSTTSAVTYKMEYKVFNAADTLYLSLGNNKRTMVLMEIGA